MDVNIRLCRSESRSRRLPVPPSISDVNVAYLIEEEGLLNFAHGKILLIQTLGTEWLGGLASMMWFVVRYQ